MIAKPISIKGAGCGGCVRKAVELLSGDLLFVPESGLRVERSILTGRQKSAAGVVVRQRMKAQTADLEKWFRRRLRSAIWKQWKRGTVRFAELRKRGVGKDLAAQTAGSAHGPWRLANSPALGFALPNAYFDSLGIPRLTGGR
jgi:hypothetical protein